MHSLIPTIPFFGRNDPDPPITGTPPPPAPKQMLSPRQVSLGHPSQKFGSLSVPVTNTPGSRNKENERPAPVAAAAARAKLKQRKRKKKLATAVDATPTAEKNKQENTYR